MIQKKRYQTRKSTPGSRAFSKFERSARYWTPNFHPGRTSMFWKCTAYISGSNVDDGELFVLEEDVYDFKFDFMDTSDTHHHTDMQVSLFDIARPTKKKGAAKDFEVVPKVRNVVALEDDQWQWQWDPEDDDWERIYNEQHATEEMSYSSVLKGLKENS